MLTRKPRIGETLLYQSPGRDAVEVVVKRFLDNSGIMVAFMPSGGEDWFIWQHRDGLNTNLSHKAL